VDISDVFGPDVTSARKSPPCGVRLQPPSAGPTRSGGRRGSADATTQWRNGKSRNLTGAALRLTGRYWIRTSDFHRVRMAMGCPPVSADGRMLGKRGHFCVYSSAHIRCHPPGWLQFGYTPPMHRPASDLGLWAICTALAFAIVGGCLGYQAWGGGWNGLPLLIGGTAVGGLGVGWGLLHRAHGRMRPLPAVPHPGRVVGAARRGRLADSLPRAGCPPSLDRGRLPPRA
jgi:hypothetical protein